MSKFFKFAIGCFYLVITNGCIQENHEIQSKSLPNQSLPNKEKCSRKNNCIRIPLGDRIATLDPGLADNKVLETEIIDQLFLGLTTLVLEKKTNTYKVVGELAKDWQVSSDKKVYTFFLRQEVRWSDGKPVTAHDVVWTIRRNLDKNSVLKIIKNAKNFQSDKSLGVRAIDDYTVEFELESAASHFPALLVLGAYRPLPKHILEDDKWDDKLIESKKITNGPYKLDKWEKGYKIILKKNPVFYDANNVKIQEVHYHLVRDNEKGFAMYENDELDIMGGLYLKLPRTEIFRIKVDLDLSSEMHTGFQACTEFYGFNTQRPPTNESSVRKAIVMAIDKQLLIDAATAGSHIPAMTITPPWFLFSDDDNEENKNKIGIPFDPKKAKDELMETYNEQIVLTHYTGEKDDREIAKAIQTLLKHYLKLEIERDEMRAPRYYKFIVGKEEPPPLPVHMFRVRMCGDYPHPHAWLDPLFNNKTGYFKWILRENKELENEFAKSIEEAQQASDITERNQSYRRAEKILTEEAVVVMPLFFDNALFLVKPWVKEWYPMAFGGQRIRDWSLSE